mgnify:CR=1 FL=1
MSSHQPPSRFPPPPVPRPPPPPRPCGAPLLRLRDPPPAQLVTSSTIVARCPSPLWESVPAWLSTSCPLRPPCVPPTPQAYFFGYVIHRLLLVALGRREEDDRDHYGNKRLDLGGPLLANLFRQLFRCGLFGSPLSLSCARRRAGGEQQALRRLACPRSPCECFSRRRRKLSKDVRGYVQKCVDKGREINLTSAISKETITRGLRCVALQ